MLDDATLYFLEGKFIIGILIFIRITGMFASGPFLKSSAIPPQVKVMLSVILATTLTAAYWKEQPEVDLHLWHAVYMVFKEFIVGAAFGFIANTVFFAAKMAGGIMDTEMGYQTAMLFDRDAGTPTLLGEFKEMMLLMIFFVTNGHHYLIEGMFISMEVIPLTTMQFSEGTVELLVGMATKVIILSVKMASPVLVALFLTNLSLALLARIAPQTNIFILSFQLKVIVGLLVLVASIPLFILVGKFALQTFQEDIIQFLMTMNPKYIAK